MDDVALDTAAFRWREALDAATDTLDEVSRSRRALGFSAPELQARVAQLEDERAETEHDLERLAGTTHTHLRRHLLGQRRCRSALRATTEPRIRARPDARRCPGGNARATTRRRQP
jgi:hypothetical protein